MSYEKKEDEKGIDGWIDQKEYLERIKCEQ